MMGFLPQLRSTILLFTIGIFSTFVTPSLVTDPNAPTASQSPESLDEIWKAASSKYDSRRIRILKDVDGSIAQGPFRPDWESLQQYQPPDWYRDAKFGIFIHWPLFRSCLRQRMVSAGYVYRGLG